MALLIEHMHFVEYDYMITTESVILTSVTLNMVYTYCNSCFLQ